MEEKSLKPALTHKDLFNSEAVQKNVTELLGSIQKSKRFTTAMLQLIMSTDLKNADPKTVYAACMTAAGLDLQVNPVFGHCYFLPFKNTKTGKTDVQFILGYKGLIQLAMRTGLYQRIQMEIIYSNEFVKWDKINEKLTLKDIEGSGEIKGYYACFETENGYKKADFWSKEKVTEHAKKYSKQKDYKTGELKNVWASEFDKMACKTVLRSILTTYGILSADLQEAFEKEIEIQEVEQKEVIDIDLAPQTDYEFTKDQITNAKDAESLDLIKSDVQEIGEAELIAAYNLKCSNLKVKEEFYIK